MRQFLSNFYNEHKFISNLSKKVVLEYDMLYLALLYVSLNKTVYKCWMYSKTNVQSGHYPKYIQQILIYEIFIEWPTQLVWFESF